MLPRSSQTSRSATIPAPGSVHPVQEYLSGLQADPTKDFPDLEEDEEHSHGQEQTEGISPANQKGGDGTFKHLVSNKDFGELFEEFFVFKHKDLTLLRSEMLLDRNINPNTLITPSDANTHKLQVLREHLYRVQMALFKSPKGQQFNMAR